MPGQMPGDDIFGGEDEDDINEQVQPPGFDDGDVGNAVNEEEDDEDDEDGGEDDAEIAVSLLAKLPVVHLLTTFLASAGSHPQKRPESLLGWQR